MEPSGPNVYASRRPWIDVEYLRSILALRSRFGRYVAVSGRAHHRWQYPALYAFVVKW